jgi:hypothetical protein
MVRDTTEGTQEAGAVGQERRGETHTRRAVAVVDVSREELITLLTEALEPAHLSLAEFVRLGRADKLEDDRLRDLWLMLRPVAESA